MRRILITGATGFVGRQILNALDRPEIALDLIVRTGKEHQITERGCLGRVKTSPDIFSESEEWWAEQCQGIDTIIHAAWYAEPGKYLQSPLNMECLQGSLRLAKAAAQAGVRRFVGIGTCFEYDTSKAVLSVDTPLRPSTPYAAAKAALFFGLSNWLHTQSVEFVWCRLFYLYGIGEDKRRLVPYIRHQLENGQPAQLTSGKQIRDFLDVEQAGKKIAEIALSDITGPVNICSGIPVTVRQFAEHIADQYGQRNLLQFGKRIDNITDPPCIVGISNINNYIPDYPQRSASFTQGAILGAGGITP